MARKRAKRKPETRRTEGVVAGERAARVIEAVFEATALEVARNGYAALRIEDVAARAKVNKTTIYRRWPAKKDLVVATIRALAKPQVTEPTGSLERDLLTALKNVVAYAISPMGRAGARLMLGSHSEPEIDAVASDVRRQIRDEHSKIFARAIEAGQLPKDTSIELIQQIIFMPILMRTLVFHEPVDESIMRDVIGFVLEGAKVNSVAGRAAAARRR